MQEVFPKVNHKRIEENTGYSGGFNRAVGWAFSRGYDYVLFCTNDTIIGKGVLKKLSELAEIYKNDLICPRINYYNKPGIDSLSGYFDKSNFTLRHYHTADLPDRLDPAKDYIPGTCFWLSKKVFEDLNGMDESYHTYWEDVDFSFRAHKKGYPVYRAFDVEISHKIGKTCHKKPLYTTYYFQRNRIRFCRQYLDLSERKAAKKIIGKELNTYLRKINDKYDAVRMDYYNRLFQELEEL
jgi:hypothetical protein